jgi:hypothetical protein
VPEVPAHARLRLRPGAGSWRAKHFRANHKRRHGAISAPRSARLNTPTHQQHRHKRSQLHLQRLRQPNRPHRDRNHPTRLRQPIHRQRHGAYLPPCPVLRSGYRAIHQQRPAGDGNAGSVCLRERQPAFDRRSYWANTVVAEGQQAVARCRAWKNWYSQKSPYYHKQHGKPVVYNACNDLLSLPPEVYGTSSHSRSSVGKTIADLVVGAGTIASGVVTLVACGVGEGAAGVEGMMVEGHCAEAGIGVITIGGVVFARGLYELHEQVP